jgi:RHS repeat-associated protein
VAPAPSVIETDPKVFPRLDDGTDPNCTTITHQDLDREREFIYGTQYIDEQVAQFNKPGQLFYVLQDANYNLTGLTTSSGTIHQQYTYTPYGELLFAEDAAAASIDFPTDPTLIATPFGFQTMWYDAETGLICIRHRCYDPVTARWTSADPNGTGLVHLSSPAHSAHGMSVHPSASPALQYDDTLNAYLYVRSNPITGRDPSGMYSEFDYFSEAESILADITGERVAGFERLERFVNTGVHAATVIGSVALSFLPGGEALRLAGKLARGDEVTFADFFYAGMSVGGAALVGKFVGGYNLAKPTYRLRYAGITAGNVPRSLLSGPKAYTVYFGRRGGNRVYVGVTRNLGRRRREHRSDPAKHYEDLEEIASGLTRRQARAIEQAVHEGNPHFENINNPIDPRQSWYAEAVEWGKAFLREHGID